MRYRDLYEMAQPTEGLRQQTFYHGTSSNEAGRSIVEHGITPGNQNDRARGHMLPVLGRSYLTSTLRYAVIYCLGGDFLGNKNIDFLVNKKHKQDGTASRYGWLFVIDGQQLLHDVQPDEDSVGEFVYQHTVKRMDHDPSRLGQFKPDGVEDEVKKRVWHNVRSSLTPRQLQNALDGEYSAWAAGGKRALKRLADSDKIALIRWGAHVAYQGVVMPDQSWRFDKLNASMLAKDGSNFFALAERIK